MHDCLLRALQSLKSLGDDMLARLGEHLDRHVVGDEVLLDQRTAELLFRLTRRGEPDLDLLKADFTKELEKLQLFLKAHGDDERLIAVAKIDAAPNGRFVDGCFFRPILAHALRFEILFYVFIAVFHNPT
jgi:hypothetical protein